MDSISEDISIFRDSISEVSLISIFEIQFQYSDCYRFSCCYAQNLALKVSFDFQNQLFGNVPNAKEGFDHNNMKNIHNPNIENRNANIEMVVEMVF